MKSFVLMLRDATSVTRIDQLASFVGEDASGSFGILPGHVRFMTCLEIGLARFRRLHEEWQYLAMPGAVLYFEDDVLNLSTRRYILDHDYQRITAALTERLLAEEESLREVKRNLKRLEQEVLKRLWHPSH